MLLFYSRIHMRSLLLLLIVLVGSAHAENSRNFGEYTVHFQAVPTIMLPPAVATAQGFVRAKNMYLLNVTVIKNNQSTGTPVTAKVSVQARDLIGKTTQIALKEVDQGDAIYYIGSFRVSNEDQWRFKLSVTPENSTSALEVSWEQKFDTL